MLLPVSKRPESGRLVCSGRLGGVQSLDAFKFVELTCFRLEWVSTDLLEGLRAFKSTSFVINLVMPNRMHLPFPYRSEAGVVSDRLGVLEDALDWPAAAQAARPWVQAVRKNPPPFWAMESLLKEYPISSAEGLALMRLAEALLRVPDADTAIALTADQLGRADFYGHMDVNATHASSQSALTRLSSTEFALSINFLPRGG